MQTKLAIRMIALHDAAAAGPRALPPSLGALQKQDDRIDIVRNVWNDELADTERLLDAFAVRDSAR